MHQLLFHEFFIITFWLEVREDFHEDFREDLFPQLNRAHLSRREMHPDNYVKNTGIRNPH